MPIVTRFFFVLGLAVLLGCSGCERLFDKGSKLDIDTADKKAMSGDFKDALRLYEAALDGSPKTADVHYKMALIYASKMKSPLDALHHFGRYLEYAPNGQHAKEARDYTAEGNRKLLAELSKGSPLTLDDAVRLKNDNLTLRTDLAKLKAQKSAPPPHPGKPGDQTQKPVPAGARTHTVEPGETLASIAQKYYNSKARWKDIQDANFYSLEGTPKIKPGMTLIIP